MSPESSPSKGWRGVAADMHVEAGIPRAFRETAAELRACGYDDLADGLEAAAELAEEAIVNE